MLNNLFALIATDMLFLIMIASQKVLDVQIPTAPQDENRIHTEEEKVKFLTGLGIPEEEIPLMRESLFLDEDLDGGRTLFDLVLEEKVQVGKASIEGMPATYFKSEGTETRVNMILVTPIPKTDVTLILNLGDSVDNLDDHVGLSIMSRRSKINALPDISAVRKRLNDESYMYGDNRNRMLILAQTAIDLESKLLVRGKGLGFSGLDLEELQSVYGDLLRRVATVIKDKEGDEAVFAILEEFEKRLMVRPRSLS